MTKHHKFKQNTLWRDKLVECMTQMGSKIHVKPLDDTEFLEQLKIKLLEEAQEVMAAQTQQTLVEELADVLEVITAFANALAVDWQSIVEAQKKKQFEKGGFEGRKFVTIAEHPEGSFGEKYCLADPEKYPEIVDCRLMWRP